MHKMFQYEYEYCCSTTCDREKVSAEFEELQESLLQYKQLSENLESSLVESEGKLAALEKELLEAKQVAAVHYATLEEHDLL